MRYRYFLLLFLIGCGGKFAIKQPNKPIYINGELACQKSSCCYPYKEKVMICLNPNADFSSGSINIKVVPEN